MLHACWAWVRRLLISISFQSLTILSKIRVSLQVLWNCFPHGCGSVMKASYPCQHCCSCLLSSVLHGPTALWVYDLLCAEIQLTVPWRSPLNSHSSSLHTVHPPLLLFLLLIIPHIYPPCRPACSMTSGLLPWRTNHAFHSGSKREVSLFCVFCFSVHICMLLLVGFVKCSFMLTEKSFAPYLWFDFSFLYCFSSCRLKLKKSLM